MARGLDRNCPASSCETSNNSSTKSFSRVAFSRARATDCRCRGDRLAVSVSKHVVERPADERERRAELVAYVGEEVGLHAVEFAELCGLGTLLLFALAFASTVLAKAVQPVTSP